MAGRDCLWCGDGDGVDERVEIRSSNSAVGVDADDDDDEDDEDEEDDEEDEDESTAAVRPNECRFRFLVLAGSCVVGDGVGGRERRPRRLGPETRDTVIRLLCQHAPSLKLFLS